MERPGQGLKGGDRDIALAAFDHADIGAMIAADVGQLFLRDAEPTRSRRTLSAITGVHPAELARFPHARLGPECNYASTD